MFGKKRISDLEDQIFLLQKELKLGEEVIERGKDTIKSLNEHNSELLKTEFKLKEDYQRKEEHSVALLTIQQEKEIHREVSKIKDEYNKKEKELIENNFKKLGGFFGENSLRRG